MKIRTKKRIRNGDTDNRAGKLEYELREMKRKMISKIKKLID